VFWFRWVTLCCLVIHNCKKSTHCQHECWECVCVERGVIYHILRYLSKNNVILYVKLYFSKYCTYILSVGLCWFAEFNAKFNNISVISWRSVLLVEETGVPGEKHRPVASHLQTFSHNVVSSTPRHERGSKRQIKWW